MIPIKHILNENGVSEIFKLIVVSGNYLGEYLINKPNGWNQVDSVVSMDEEHFYVDSFIIGESNKISFGQIDNPIAFDILRKVYREQGGDGQVVFKWIAKKESVEYDLLKDNFEINFNKYSDGFDKSMRKIDIEILKSEHQNKLFNREDITVDLFAEKDLDENDILPVETFDIGYKKGDKSLSNFYTYDISQYRFGAIGPGFKNGFFSFKRSEEYGFGNNSNNYASYTNFDTFLLARKYQGDFVSTNISIPNIKAEISNLEIEVNKGSGVLANASLYALIKNGVTGVRSVKLADSISGIIKIDNEIFNIGNLNPNENLTFEINSNENVNIGMYPIKTNTSIEITTNLESPLVKTKGIRLISAFNQLVKNYTSSGLNVISNYIELGGAYYNTSISTGVYLRGLPTVYLNQKIKTSFKNAFTDGAAKLMALGFDILNDNVVIEDVSYFFKDIKSYDLSDKIYIQTDFKIENDKDVVFNSLQFGSKKYSTNVKDDIKNFTTTSEFSTPIKSVKNKFDKETELIIDEFKIQELIEDKTTSTNDNDDDLVLIDMVNLTDYWDTGVFENTVHSIDGGNLMLNCTTTPFDTTMIEVGALIEITEGLNVGQWTVLNVDLSKMKLSKITAIQEGVNDTPIRYRIATLTKNRTNDGFTDAQNIRNFETATNIRHNPKYHMARWFPWFGSGLRKKLNSELIKVTDYKNNSDAQMRINSVDLINELPDLVTVGADETLGRLRNYAQTLFNGDKITISYFKVSFEEFINIYENWRYGEGEDRLKSRGYLTLNTPFGIYDVFPFGEEAFKHSKEKNILTINAKIKGKSVDNPTLLRVVQIDKRTVELEWDFNENYINPTSRVQYSLDGINWLTLADFLNIKTATIESDLFLSIFTGTEVFFRVLVSTADYYNKISNTLQINWQFNSWIFKENSRIENTNCGNSYLNFEIIGVANLEINWEFTSNPGGGFFIAYDYLNNDTIENVSTIYGSDQTELRTSLISISNETKTIQINIKNSDKTEDLKILNCNNTGTPYPVFAGVKINIKDLSNDEIIEINLSCITIKRFIDF